MAKAKGGFTKQIEELRDYALTYPGSTEDFPWGERVIKVKGKVFLFLSKLNNETELNLSVKLPETCTLALLNPRCKPTGYGLGKHGWVSAHFKDGDTPAVEEIKAWIDESYRAVAPKKLLAVLDGPKEQPPLPSKPKKKR